MKELGVFKVEVRESVLKGRMNVERWAVLIEKNILTQRRVNLEKLGPLHGRKVRFYFEVVK